MGTDLHAITNYELTGKETCKDWNLICSKLEKADLIFPDESYNEEPRWETDLGSNYEPGIVDYLVCFDHPYGFSIELYPECAIISSAYRYWVLKAEFYYGAEVFQHNFQALASELGQNEIIYLGDNHTTETTTFLYSAMDGNSYQQIKQQLHKELGLPLSVNGMRKNPGLIKTRYVLETW